MLSDAKKKANAKWDKAHMMILGCKVRKDLRPSSGRPVPQRGPPPTLF